MCLMPYIFSLRQFVTEFAAKCIFLSTMSRCLCVRIRRQPCSPFWKADDNVGRGRRCSEKWSTAAAFGFFWANERPTINWKAVFNALSQPARGSKSNERESYVAARRISEVCCLFSYSFRVTRATHRTESKETSHSRWMDRFKHGSLESPRISRFLESTGKYIYIYIYSGS